MTQPSLVAQSKLMLTQVRNAGQMPIFFGMNEHTMRELARELADLAQAKRSLLGRVASRLRGENAPEAVQSLHGLPVNVDPRLANDVVFLACAQHVPQGAPVPPHARAGQQENAVGPMAEFQQKMAAEPGEGVPTLTDMAKGDGLTPTAVLIKAMENLDDIKHVVVIRVHHNDDVELCLTSNLFEAQGIVQKAQYWLATRG